MEIQPRVQAFNVHCVTLGGLIPLARYYNCVHCDHDLTDWVMKQAPSEPASCPNCEARIDNHDIAQAQRDTRLGCLWTVASIAGLFFGFAAVVAVIWLLTGPQSLLRF